MQTILENLRSYNENFPEVRQAPMTQPSAAGYEVLRARLQELRQRYNEDDPEVRETRNELAEALAREANALPVTPQRIRVGANVQAANLIGKVDPVYPPLAEQARIQGTVRFMVIIGKDGRFANIQLVSGHPLLVQAAKDALEQYVYKPTLLNGQPVEVVTQVDVPFTLQ
jgi:TonB family protein